MWVSARTVPDITSETEMTYPKTPTMHLWLDVAHGSPQYWVWQVAEGPIGEYAYSAQDLRRLLLSYGAVVAARLVAGDVPRYRVRVVGAVVGLAHGFYEWSWQPLQGRYAPCGEPWVIWPRWRELDAATRLVWAGIEWPDSEATA